MDTDRIIGGAKEIGGKAQQAAGDLVGDQETNAKGVANQVAGAAQNVYGQAKDTVRDAVDQAREAAPELVDRASQVGQRYLDQGNRAVAGRVGEQQIVALLVAAAAGYALAWLFHSRSN